MSSCSKERNRFRISGVFFHGQAAPSGPTHPPAQHLAAEQLGLAAGDRIGVQPEELCHPLFPARAPSQTFQAGVESAVLFIQQTVKEGLGRLQVVAGVLLGLSGGPLLLPSRSVQCAIKITPLPRAAVEPPGLRQLTQRVLGRYLHEDFQFINKVARRSLGHQSGRRVQERAVAGKVDVAVSPQTQIIILGDGVQRVVSPAMGVAALVRQGGQLAKHGDRNGGAQSSLELGHGGDFLVVKKVQNPARREVNCIHNVILTPIYPLSSTIITF